jgi:hypothetical protein
MMGMTNLASMASAAGPRPAPPCEAQIAADPFRAGFRMLITGLQGFERTVAFARDEASKRIVSAAAQTKRWAAARKPKVAAATPVPAKAARKKRRLSPEGRARIVAATKMHWRR